MEIRKVDQGKDKKGFYFKYEIPKRDGGANPISEEKVRKAIKDFLAPVPVVIKRKKDSGYFEATIPNVTNGYRHIFAQVLN